MQDPLVDQNEFFIPILLRSQALAAPIERFTGERGWKPVSDGGDHGGA
jgi:hypothetical protein